MAQTMGDYTGVRCPLCEKTFTQEDDVVVCPVCGTPYHRACYAAQGRCINEALHESGGAWSRGSQQEQDERKYDGSSPLRCSKCGTVNPPSGIFCQVCGSRLDGTADEARDPAGFSPDPISMNAYTTPYGGVSPDEELDGVPVRDIALFVGENSHYFIPRFRDQLGGVRSPAWNWPAFLFRGFYFLFRKMYVAGALLILLGALFSLPAFLCNMGVVLGLPVLFGVPLAALNRAALACNALSFGLSLGCAFFSNRLYCGHVLRRIRKLRAQFGDDYNQDFVAALTKAGRTNRLLIVALLCGALLLSMLSSFILVLSVV